MECPNFNSTNLKVISPIGSGNYGDVFLVSDNKKDLYAVKITKNNSIPIFKELAIQSVIDSPYVMKTKLIFNNGEINVAMPLAPIGLLEILKPEYTFNDRISICRKILEGLACLHSNGVLHLDIKPDNILLRLVDRGDKSLLEPYIIDFGLSKITKSMISGKNVPGTNGSRDYLPPEILLKDNAKNIVYNDKVDIWSYGVTLFHIFTGEKLYTSEVYTSQSVYGFIQARLSGGTLSRFLWNKLNKMSGITIQAGDIELIYHLIGSCLEIDEKKRPNSIQLLNYPVFSRLNTPREPCYFSSLTGTPKNIKRSGDAAKSIVKLCNTYTLFLGLNISILFHAIDISYMYFLVGDTEPNLSFLLACIFIAIKFEDFRFEEEDIQKVLTFFNSKITPDEVIKTSLNIILALEGKIWRKYIYYSIKTKEDIHNIFNIIYSPEMYYNFKPKFIDPFKYEEPSSLQNMIVYKLFSH